MRQASASHAMERPLSTIAPSRLSHSRLPSIRTSTKLRATPSDGPGKKDDVERLKQKFFSQDKSAESSDSVSPGTSSPESGEQPSLDKVNPIALGRQAR